MQGYLQNPKDMDNATLLAWVRNFQDQPPTLDYIVEHSWAMSVIAESKRREQVAADGKLERDAERKLMREGRL